jgi:argonaute-like protein implicated in RNA metabolism and viral defense
MLTASNWDALMQVLKLPAAMHYGQLTVRRVEEIGAILGELAAPV